MKIIATCRNEGKTTELIKMSAQTGDYIVCYNASEASSIQLKAQEMGLRIPFPITYNEFLTKRYFGIRISGFLIDNADQFLQQLTPVQIKAITLTNQ